MPRINPNDLNAFCSAVYVALGVPEADAHLVADSLVQADLWGHQSHGVMRLSWYAARIRAGVMEAVTKPEFVVDASAVAGLDGHGGNGPGLTSRAARRANHRAQHDAIHPLPRRHTNPL